MPRGDEHRDHLAVQVAPRRLAVQQQHRLRGACRTVVDVVHPQMGAAAIAGVDVEVVGLPWKPDEPIETRVRGTERTHHHDGSEGGMLGATASRQPPRGRPRRSATVRAGGPTGKGDGDDPHTTRRRDRRPH